MFQKPTFGSNATSGFGSFNTGTSTASPFGFKSTGTSAFSATPTFGAGATTQPATGGGLFGSTNTTGGLFGNTSAATTTPAFGANTSGFGFGASTSTGGGLFGNTQSSGLFGNTQNTSTFGAKPAGFGFGSSTTTPAPTGGLFGSTPAAGTGLFGQQNNSMSGGGLFGSTTPSAFGQQQAPSGTAHTKYNPIVGTDVVVKSGTSQNINIKHHCITCMKEYENKSLEELRLEDYMAGRKGAQGGMFGGFQQPQTENKPLFGGTSFGQPATTSAPSVFGGGGLTTGGFGQTNTFSFGNTQNTSNTSTLFGANKPAFGATSTPGTGLFSATTTQAPAFGSTTTSSFGFGANTQNQTGGLFGPKPATTGFGTTPASSGFGSFGTSGGLFGAKPQQTSAPTFGTATSTGFGGLSSGFGTNTSTSGSIFGGNNTFGKPATGQPTFGFNTQPTLGTGLVTGLGANTFQAKPAAPAFGLGTNTMFNTPANNNTFKTGLDSGLGGGLFSNTSTLGSSAFGLGGLNTNNTSLANNNLSGWTGQGNVHEQMMTLVARPYGDSPLLSHLTPLPGSTTEDILKPTNPAAVKAVLDKNQGEYRMSNPQRLRIKVNPVHLAHDKKSLFDGLEESDPSLEEKLCLKPSRKRLVLRQQSNDSRAEENNNSSYRSNEDSQQQSNNSPSQADKENKASEPVTREDSHRRQEFNDSTNVDSSIERHGSWLSSPKPQWNDKEKPIDGDPTPRLYPNLDKELTNQGPDRRASWLTTKPLRKPLGVGNTEHADNSIREMGLRSNRQSIEKDNDNLSVSEEENVSPRVLPPHPAGVKLTRPGYYTIPPLDELTNYLKPDGSCVVPYLTVGRTNYGSVRYDTEIDVAGLDLDTLVHFLNKEVTVYPDDSDKPPVGEGLNRRAIVTLDRIWPQDKTERRPIMDPDRLLKMDYEGKLRRACDKHNTKFIEYRPDTGSWVFRVEHFSKYRLTDSDEEDDPAPEVLKRQLVTQTLQTSAPPAPPSIPSLQSQGLGSFGLSSDLNQGPEHLVAHQTSLNIFDGTSKVFDMDTEDNIEAPSLYDSRAFGVKSPTSELARLENRQSHNVQLMKASLYADTDMEEDMSVSTGDQLVPLSTSATTRVSIPDRHIHLEDIVEEERIVHTEEIPMKPLGVQPHTIVLKYHRKVPPFKHTIAGGLHASYIADMSVCRARHARVGFGPAGAMVYTSSYDSVSDLHNSGDLTELGRYVRGRTDDDWSEPVVVRLKMGHTDDTYSLQDVMSRHLETMLEFSNFSDVKMDQCPRLSLRQTPSDRLEVLRRHLMHAEKYKHHTAALGVTGSYCYQVWKLCDALWADELLNDGLPGTDELSIVTAHKKLLEWFAAAVADTTDHELSTPTPAEKEDESDGHSARVWTLLLGGRVVEACKVAREHRDLNMSALIAQAAGDPLFRSLISRQLSLWRECGADGRIAMHRLASLQLLAGTPPLQHLVHADWLRALHATARYLCPLVPTLEQIIRKYESFFVKQESEEEVDLSTVEEDEMGMKLPLPQYCGDYEVVMEQNGKCRRVLDVRYSLLRSRAVRTRASLKPHATTTDPHLYQLCFLVDAWFGTPSVETIVGLAEQLENCGAWHLAVHTLAYHPHDAARGHLIRGVISRHAPAVVDSPDMKSRLELIRRLRVPDEWLLTAQAHRAKYQHLPTLEAQYLCEAGEWNAAHRVLLEHLLPDAVLADNLESISPLLEKMSEAARRHQVSGWESGGQALHHYIRVCNEIRGVVSSAESCADRGSVAARLESLRPAVSAACRALGALQPRSVRGRFARAEMGSRLLQLGVAGGLPPSQLAAMVSALRLPPDCTAHAQHKIATELAEQASEMCIESASSSPISSHHRMTLSQQN